MAIYVTLVRLHFYFKIFTKAHLNVKVENLHCMINRAIRVHISVTVTILILYYVDVSYYTM